MFPRLHQIALCVVLTVMLAAGAMAQIVVSQDGRGDFSGTDEKPIVAAIARAHANGGGEIVIHPGVYTVQRTIELKSVKNVKLRGLPGAVLKLLPLQYAEVSRDVAAGETTLPFRVRQGITADVLLQIQAPGAIDTFSGKARPTFFVKLSKVEAGHFVLAEPLKYPVPAKTYAVNENGPNLLELRNSSEGITIEGLTIDGGRTPNDPAIPAHAQRCGIFAAGPYNYTDGPTGNPVRGVTIRDCTIRNCFGRGVAFYSVCDALVANCRIEDNVDEAIDLDHFTVNCRVLDNHVARCRVGVELNDANECWVARNRFEACQTGVTIWRWCKMDDLNVRNHILDNVFLNIAGNGLQFQSGTSGNIARGNIIRGAGRNGVSLGASDTMVAGNIIERPGMHGIAVAGDRNDIVGNRVVEAGAGASQPYAGIRILGADNRALDNSILAGGESKTATQPVSDGGKGNTVR